MWGPGPVGRTILLPVALQLGTCACEGGRTPGPEAWFEEPTRELGLPVASGDRPDGAFFTPEIMQGGVGLFDADLDGALDLLHVRIPPPGAPERTITNRLYQAENGRFRDVTDASGITAEGYGQGLAIGDTDNDGDPDVYVTNYGPDVFYVNQGGGRFANATAQAGFADEWWGTSAAFADYDADGFLDLYVANYLRYEPGKRCTDPSDRREYCGPRSFNGAPDLLYRNDGDGTFTERTNEAGIVLPQQWARGTGLGVVFTDLTNDGWPDVFVANDAQANQLWVNRGDGTFSDEAILRGVALDRNGRTEANMGIGVGDVNGDGLLDLFVTHLWEEYNRLWIGTKGPLFRDFTIESQLPRAGTEQTGFGCGLFDFDHDGDLDLAVANGAVRRRPPIPGGPRGMWASYAEPNQLFVNDGQARFAQEDGGAGPFASQIEVSRGLAFGDLDEDGDVDMVLSNIDNSLRVYRNRAPKEGRHWLIVRALTGKRDAIGAHLWLRAGEREFRGLVLPGSSYCSSNDPRAHFGLGPIASLDELVVQWPDRQRERFAVPGVDRVLTVRQGEGREP